MDIQLKKGILDILVLVVLKDNDSYGYKIVQEMSAYIAVSESTLYPILRRLECAGALDVYNAEHSGRLRKYYKVTKQGIAKVKDFMAEYDEFLSIYEYIKRRMEG